MIAPGEKQQLRSQPREGLQIVPAIPIKNTTVGRESMIECLSLPSLPEALLSFSDSADLDIKKSGS